MQFVALILTLALVSFLQVRSIRFVSLHPVPVTSTRFLLLRAGWAVLLGSCGWALLGPGFWEWVQPRAGLLVLLGVALLAFVEHLSRHLLFAYSQQWNERAVWGLMVAALVGLVASQSEISSAPATWLICLRLIVVVLVLGTFYARTKRRADRTRWHVATGTYHAS